MKTMYSLLIVLGFCSLQYTHAQCEISPFVIRSFEFNGTNYEMILEAKNWQEAASCAVSRGGKLVEINSQEEQDAVYDAMTDLFIDASQTVAPDGGNASYFWLGGNDASSEGNWAWNGDNDAQFSPFWQGTANGSPVNGSYENWGNEPDNWNNQDGLAIAFTDWPLGQSGQWNDVFLSNELFFIIEYPSQSLGTSEKTRHTFTLSPNPVNQLLTISFPDQEAVFRFTDLSGKTVLVSEAISGVHVVDISVLAPGTYLVHAGKTIQKLVIE